MSRVFVIDPVWELFTTICFVIELLMLISIMYLFIVSIQHNFCIPESTHHPKIEPKHIKTYSTLVSIFITISASLSFGMNFGCDGCPKWYSDMFESLDTLFLDFYILAKGICTFFWSIRLILFILTL